jgi:hypothetical protein
MRAPDRPSAKGRPADARRGHGTIALVLSLAGLLSFADALGGCGAGRGAAASVETARGPWKLVYFAGGPPLDGQITDTISCDPATGRRVHVERVRAGAAGTTSCEADIADDAAWSTLVEAMSDDDLRSALAHPDRLPGLVIDAGYFSCHHGGVDVAVSSASSSESAETKAVRKLGSAYQRVRAIAIASPGCAGLPR